MTSNNIILQCKLLSPDAKAPTKNRSGDAGWDLYSNMFIQIPPRSFVNIPTDIALSAPEGYYYTIEGRSGLGAKQILPFRGIIDSGYTGCLKVLLHNLSDQPYEVLKHDRIAQICIHKIEEVQIVLVDEFTSEYVTRGTAGFGSSGR